MGRNPLEAWKNLPALWVWFVGFILSGVPVVVGLSSLRKVLRGTTPVTDPAMLELARQLAARLGLRRSVQLVLSPQREIPMTWGVLRPVVLLPIDAVGWSEERLTIVLLHEYAHVKRWDCLTQLIARGTCAVYWFSPLSWFALARVRREQEQASDDLALGCGLDRHSYAAHLLAIVTGRKSGGPRSAVALAMASTTKLERRLTSIIDAERSRRNLSRRSVGLVTFATLAFLLPLAALRPLSGAESARDQVVTSAEPAQVHEPSKPDPADAVESEVLAKVREIYVKRTDESALRNGAIKGILNALNDPYSSFMDSQQLAQMDSQLEGKLTGIGAQLELKDGNVTIVTPVPDSPASRAGLKPGDVIEQVDEQPTRGIELSAVVKRILGKPGEVVRLKVKHADGRVENLAITRGIVAIQSVRGFRPGRESRDAFFDPEHAIGYLRISQLGNDTPAEMREAIGRLNDREMKGLVLDLRGCPGGLLDASVEVVKLFLSKGTVVTIRGRDEVAKPITADGPAIAQDVPLVVLIDGSTASAGEIVAGALKDNDRAVVVGSRTFGKGSVQTVVKLKDGSGAIRLTTAYYELPRGGMIDKQEGKTSWGVDPTDGYFVPVDGDTRKAMARKRLHRDRLEEPPAGVKGAKMTPNAIEQDEADPQLAAALTTLIARTTRGEFVKVGLPVSEQTARILRLDEARKRRQSLLEDLKKVEKELGELSSVSGVREPTP